MFNNITLYNSWLPCIIYITCPSQLLFLSIWWVSVVVKCVMTHWRNLAWSQTLVCQLAKSSVEEIWKWCWFNRCTLNQHIRESQTRVLQFIYNFMSAENHNSESLYCHQPFLTSFFGALFMKSYSNKPMRVWRKMQLYVSNTALISWRARSHQWKIQ